MNIDNISVEADGELIFVTVAKYKLFLSYGKTGLDAYMLYSHLMFTARLQSTNSVKAKEIYLRQGLGWGKERLYAAKKLLVELALIKTTQRKNKDGTFAGSYIQVKTKTTPFEIESITGGTDTVGRIDQSPVGDHKCFNKEVKCLNEKENAYNEYLETWNSIKELTTHTSKTVNTYIKKKHLDIIKETKDTLKQSIINYSKIISSDDYYFNHKWTFWDFINNAYKFANNVNPFDNYRVKKPDKVNNDLIPLPKISEQG